MTTSAVGRLADAGGGPDYDTPGSCGASKHDTRAAYVAGCRCPDARKANREYAHYRKQRTAQAAFGAAVPFTVPVSDTRSVIDQLRGIGWTLRRIEAETHIGRDHLARIYGNTGRPLTRVRWATHQKLAALLEQDPVIAGGALIDAYTTWQRIHGLIALGYPKTWIAGQLDIGRALQLGEYVVTARNAEKVRALADRYGASLGPSARARAYAAERGWTPDLIWQADTEAEPSDVVTENVPVRGPGRPPLTVVDDVDPVVVERLLSNVPVTSARTSEQYAAYAQLRERGRTATAACERLRLSSSARTLFADTYDAAHRDLEETG